jgi:hypothetical protein
VLDLPTVQAALTRVARAAGIEPGEGRIFVWAVATFFLVHSASVSLANASDTFFLKRIGVNLLPVAFLISSLLLVVTTSAMVRLATRRAQMPLLTRTLFGLALALVPLWLLALADVRSVFILLVLVSKQVEAIALLVFWVAVGGLLHSRQAKRLYAPIVAGGTVGDILGSFASASIGRSLGIAALLPTASVALAVAALLAMRARSLPPARLAPLQTRRATDVPSAIALLVPLWQESRLFRILAVSALLCGALGPMLYFQFSYAADRATQGADAELQLLSLYAAFRGWLNVAVLALQLLGTARLYRRIGVPLAAALSPLIYLLGFFGVSLQLGLRAAVASMAAATVQDHAVYDPAQQVLVTLFPERQRPAATTLISGPVPRAGAVLGNLLVLAVLAVGTAAWVGLVGIPLAGLWAAAALTLWRIYPTLLLEMASIRRLYVEEGLALPELVDPATQRVLAASLVDPNPQRVRAACTLVVEGPPGPAAAALAHATARAPAATRPLLLAALHRLLDRNGDTRPSVADSARELEALFDDPQSSDAAERADLVEAYARLVPDLAPGSHSAQVLARLMHDPHAPVRLAATARLSCAGALDLGKDELDAMLATALAGDDEATRHVALDELRAVLLRTGTDDGGDGERWAARLALLEARLADPRDRVRAVEIFADLAAQRGGQMGTHAERVLAYAGDPDPSVRSAVLRFVGQARLQPRIGWVVARLASDDEGEAAAAADALRALGPAAIHTLLDTLHRGKRAARQAVLPILRDLHVDATTLRTLIDGEIATIQRTRLLLHGLARGRVSSLVVQRLRERVDENAHSALLLLATLENEDRLAVLGRLLARSPHGRSRDVLLEAVEALLPPEQRLRLMPLLDDVDGRAAVAAAHGLGRALPSYDDALGEAMAGSDALTTSFLAATLAADRVAGGAAMGDTGAHHDGAEEDGQVLNRVEIVLHLRGLDLFARLTTRQLSEIAAVVHEEVHTPGTAIVREGEFGDCMYLILSGEVVITREGQYTITTKAGELFGEMSLFDGETRLATVTAARRTRLLRLDRHALFELMDEEPAIAIGICQTLSRHVRDSIQRLETLLEEQKKAASRSREGVSE